jgi:glycosyltransferase involved in cell wall biosynthesis
MDVPDSAGATLPPRLSESLVSIVIIARNEERFIRQCITSCLEAAQGIPGTEIILVDFRSSDRTVEHARQYPIAILELGEGQVLSPAAGRYVGYRHAQGRFIFFIDGDMVLDRDWLRSALPVFDRLPDLAGIGGISVDCPEGDLSQVMGQAPPHQDGGVEDVTVLNGAALFRKDTMDEAGCYNPYLKGAEEAELSIRLRSHGYRLVRKGIPMTCHLGVTKYSRLSLMRVSYFQGIGQILRGSLGRPYYRDIFTHFFRYIVNTIFVYTSLAFLATKLILNRLFILVFLAIHAAIMILVLIRYRIPERAVQSLIRYYLKGWYITRGFVRGMGQPKDYPATEVINPEGHSMRTAPCTVSSPRGWL